jgi:hypothetical protein
LLPAHNQRGKIDPSSNLPQSVQHQLHLCTGQHAGQAYVAGSLDQGTRSQQQRVTWGDECVVETHIDQRPDPERGRFLSPRKTPQIPIPKKPGLPGAGLEDKEVVIVKNSGDKATLAPVGGGGMQVGVEQASVCSRCRPAQRGRDATDG